MNFMEMKKEIIIDRALKLFLEKPILNVTIKDISEANGVGEATIYRYFQNKENILVLCAIKLTHKLFDDYFDLSHYDNGYKKIKEFYYCYLYVFKNHPEYLRFINYFDAYVINKDSENVLRIYEASIDKYKKVFIDAYNEGIKDLSIKEIKDIDIFYYSTTKSLLELCKREATSNDLLVSDTKIDKSILIEKLINIILDNIKK